MAGVGMQGPHLGSGRQCHAAARHAGWREDTPDRARHTASEPWAYGGPRGHDCARQGGAAAQSDRAATTAAVGLCRGGAAPQGSIALFSTEYSFART